MLLSAVARAFGTQPLPGKPRNGLEFGFQASDGGLLETLAESVLLRHPSIIGLGLPGIANNL